jgi:hypothetical protein
MIFCRVQEPKIRPQFALQKYQMFKLLQSTDATPTHILRHHKTYHQTRSRANTSLG